MNADKQVKGYHLERNISRIYINLFNSNKGKCIGAYRIRESY